MAGQLGRGVGEWEIPTLHGEPPAHLSLGAALDRPALLAPEVRVAQSGHQSTGRRVAIGPWTRSRLHPRSRVSLLPALRAQSRMPSWRVSISRFC